MKGMCTVEKIDLYRVTINGREMLCEKAEELFNGYLKVFKDGIWTLIDKNGKTICSGKSVEIYKCKEGMIRVYNGEKYTYISGITLSIWPFIFEDAEDFENGIAKVRYDGRERYISKAGRFVTS